MPMGSNGVRMKYKTKEWQFDAFQVGVDDTPEWWKKLVTAGKAFEYPYGTRFDDKPHYGFSDKRTDYKAYYGDWIFRDEFGWRGVFSEKNFAARSKLI